MNEPLPRIGVVLNPAAGRGRGQGARNRLETLLAATGAEWRIAETRRAGEGAELARRLADEGFEVVAAAGGDGTIGEVLNGLLGTEARLALLPLGTGNDLARHLGLGRSLESSLDTALRGARVRVDAGRLGERLFLNVAGCGFDAAVAERVNAGFRRFRGTTAYVAAVLRTLTAYRPARMRIVADGELLELKAMLCCVANSRSYGGGMRIAPEASITDGLFDVCILEEVGRLEFLRAFPRVFRGTHASHPRVRMLRARTVRIESERPLPVLVDGDVVQTTPADFTVLPGAVQLTIPTEALGRI